MNKKQFIVTIILVCFMMILLTVEKAFDNNVRSVTLTNNNMGTLKNYSALEGRISYQIPENWGGEEKKYPGNYIVYDNSFVNKEMGILGYIQIINSPKNIDDIIKNDKEKLHEYKTESYKASREKRRGEEIHKVSYKEKNIRGGVYINTIFYKDILNNKKLKILFSFSEDKYKENYSTIHEVILDSFKELK